MPELYDLDVDTTECPECGTELIFLAYKGGYLGCPECIPSGLVNAYKV